MRTEDLRQVAEREVVGIGELKCGIRAGTVGVLVAIDGIHRFFSLPVRTCIRKSVFSEFQRPIPSSILVINWPLLF
jgi:hypothetical protein